MALRNEGLWFHNLSLLSLFNQGLITSSPLVSIRNYRHVFASYLTSLVLCLTPLTTN
jgi:hypothetical protein